MNPSEETQRPFPAAPRSAPVNREVYQELRRIAAQRMAGQLAGHTLQPTELVHEAWLRLRGTERGWKNHGHFLASATLTMRRILIDHARRKTSFRRDSDLGAGDSASLAAASPSENLLKLDDGISALEQVHPLHARVVIARFFAGLTTEEIAAEHGLSERSVDRYWAFAKVWLARWMTANS